MTDESMSYLDALKEIKRLKEAWEKAREEIKYHADNIKYTDAYRDGFEVSLNIIDKHISELRGDTDVFDKQRGNQDITE